MATFECPQMYLKCEHANAEIWSETIPIPVSLSPLPSPKLTSTAVQRGSGDDPTIYLLLQVRGLGVLSDTPRIPSLMIPLAFSQSHLHLLNSTAASLDQVTNISHPTGLPKHPLAHSKPFSILKQRGILKNANLSVVFHCS